MRTTDVLIIGGGQAGLAASFELTQRGLDHVVLERDRIAETWRRRWDSFCLVSPNWTVQLPGYAYAGGDPDGFMLRAEIVEHLEAYAASFGAPVRTNTCVTDVRQTGERRFEVTTPDEVFLARSLILATGAYQKPHRPGAAQSLPASLLQIDVAQYSRPDALPDGAILIVGNGQSGCQIAEELQAAGRQVVLSCGRAPWVPRRPGGRDVFWWLDKGGFLETPASEIPAEGRLVANAICTGHDGGHDLNLRILQQAGVTLVGRFLGARDGTLRFADDLAESVAWADDRFAKFAEMLSATATRLGVAEPKLAAVPDFEADMPQEIDCASLGAVIFACGFRPDYASWLPWPEAIGKDGFPHQVDGKSTTVDGLYFLGLHLLRKRKSSLLLGVGEDAALVAAEVAGAPVPETARPA